MTTNTYKFQINLKDSITPDQIKQIMLRCRIWLSANRYKSCVLYCRKQIEINVFISEMKLHDYSKLESIIKDLIKESGEFIC